MDHVAIHAVFGGEIAPNDRAHPSVEVSLFMVTMAFTNMVNRTLRFVSAPHNHRKEAIFRQAGKIDDYPGELGDLVQKQPNSTVQSVDQTALHQG
ncbi:MAG: hypothetical protein K5905_18850 [Roseibium sp.]|uniref:hypothetical protein n=1 Tax=Roseibium sp. TaxID=1936156 RepID=UPI00260AFA57|nr:hypothetical protein [Roseibium sp.]MCV0427522.1 hypothetical protein [Roseibium sp.]